MFSFSLGKKRMIVELNGPNIFAMESETPVTQLYAYDLSCNME